MVVLGWRCWYDDGTEYNSVDHRWADLPDVGLQIRMVFSDVGREIQNGVDRYWEHETAQGKVYGAGHESIAEVAANYPGAVIKSGLWVNSDFFKTLLKRSYASSWF